MKLAQNGVWFISRNARSNINPSEVAEDPKRVLSQLLNGHIWLAPAPRILNDRGYYGSEKNTINRGEFSYNIAVALPPKLRAKFSGLIVYDLAGEPIYLSRISEANQYQRVVVDPEQARELLPYAIIHGGVTAPGDEVKMLDELYFGEGAQEIMDELFNKEGREWQSSFYKHLEQKPTMLETE